MLKKGQVYKAIYDLEGGGNYRNFMIFSPSMDASSRSIQQGRLAFEWGGCPCLVAVILNGDIKLNTTIGFSRLVKIERPHTAEDYREIDRILEMYKFLEYNKEFNRLEGYEEHVKKKS